MKQAALELEAERAEEGEEAYNFFTSQQESQAEEAGEREANGEEKEEEGEGKEEKGGKEDEVYAKLQVGLFMSFLAGMFPSFFIQGSPYLRVHIYLAKIIRRATVVCQDMLTNLYFMFLVHVDSP